LATASRRPQDCVKAVAAHCSLSPGSMVRIDEDILTKTGAELYKELLRVYPIAEVEDYHKNGSWKDDLLKLDLRLIYAHAREAGAPYPPPLEEVKVPELPKSQIAMARSNYAGGVAGQVRPTMGAGMAGGVRPTSLSAMPGSGGAMASPAAELRLIALFVAKWKLDPARTKVLLARLTAPKRRYVIQAFKGPDAGTEVMESLDKFIQECEATDAWASAVAAAAASASTQMAVFGQGQQQAAGPSPLKRMAPPTMSPDSKRPRMMMGAPLTARPGMPSYGYGRSGMAAPGLGAPRPTMPMNARPTPPTTRPNLGCLGKGGVGMVRAPGW